MTRTGSATAANPAERVATCQTCGLPILAVGARGPLPTRHPECRPPSEQLLYQVRSAARLAHTIGRQAIGHELDAIAAVVQQQGTIRKDLDRLDDAHAVAAGHTRLARSNVVEVRRVTLDQRLEDQLEAAALRRLTEAREEMHAAARAVGLDPERIGELHAPLSLRIDAWLERTRRLLAES